MFRHSVDIVLSSVLLAPASAETGDAKPTDGAAYEVFEELSDALEGHLTALEQMTSTQRPTVNDALRSEGLDPVERDPEP